MGHISCESGNAQQHSAACFTGMPSCAGGIVRAGRVPRNRQGCPLLVLTWQSGCAGGSCAAARRSPESSASCGDEGSAQRQGVEVWQPALQSTGTTPLVALFSLCQGAPSMHRRIPAERLQHSPAVVHQSTCPFPPAHFSSDVAWTATGACSGALMGSCSGFLSGTLCPCAAQQGGA